MGNGTTTLKGASVSNSGHRWVRPVAPLVGGALLLLIASFVVSTSLGAVAMPAGTVWHILLNNTPFLRDFFAVEADWPTAWEAVVVQIRLPRVVLAAMVGACLAAAGATYQGLFRNPLADPFLIGVASGAGLGAVLAMALPLQPVLYNLGVVQWLAFAGGGLAIVLVMMLARVGKTTPLATLMLAGVALGSLCNALTSFIMYMQEDRLARHYSWLLGGFSQSSWSQVLVMAPYLLLGIGVIQLYAGRLNVLQFDEEQAAQLGINVERMKLILIAAATLTTAAAVSVSGLIGFVGLIVPHAVRLIWGPNYRLLLPLSALLGGLFLLWADVVARTVLAPAELPVGIVTALCGAPFFIWLLRQRKRMIF